ncbi:family 16 glycoside hydrolase [Bifidobacterium callitrichos]|uniref:galactosylceramidase n=1 Tax=Bifidobacterium callitrichos DSM 23973 TaxID=1437609 RepID=A0A087A6U9_9BIFI|nr:family 16 glycoside hydrolase [Bifidobacterium callitrichos]KFI54499.1 sugar-binding protein [Bifidobacterium callitrichos DSM 23973]
MVDTTAGRTATDAKTDAGNDTGSGAWPQTVHIALNAADVERAAKNRNGLTYKGFGLLSGNATSSLLMDYKAESPESYWTLVKTLFAGDHPLMNTVKVEMGNDRNNSTGPNVATMRDRDEYPQVRREPGFQLAADARRYQPDVHVSILRWMVPTWVHSNEDVYRWYKNTILAAYREYGFMIDSVNPDVNERTADLEWVADFAHRVRTDEEGFIGNGPDDPNAGFASDEERSLFHAIKVITSDEEVTGTFGGDVIANPTYMDAMDVASYHYSVEDDQDGNFTRLADEFDKEVWNSEAQATFSNSADRPNNTMDDGLGERTGTGIGGSGSALEMANTLIKGFVESRRTHAIYQPAIGSCYENMEYASKELISARDPWSGWIYYDAGCAVLEHFTKFAKLGFTRLHDGTEVDGIWRAIPSASGSEVGGNNPVAGARHGEPSYLTLASPDGKDFSTIIVNDSARPKTYVITADSALKAFGKPLQIWVTKACDPESGEAYDANYRRPLTIVPPAYPDETSEVPVDSDSADSADSTVSYTLTVEPWSIITATTLDTFGPAPDDTDDRSGRTDEGRYAPKAGYEYDLPHTAENARPVLDVDPEHGVLYADDFRYEDEQPVDVFKSDALAREDYLESRGGDAGATARYTTDTNGAFEIVPDSERGHVLRQQIDWNHAGNAWIEGEPRTAIGDMRWTDYQVSVDVKFEDYPGRSPYVVVGAREMGGNKFTTDICGVDFKIRADGIWLLRNFGNEVRRGHLEDLRKRAAEAGTTPFAPGAGSWNTITLRVVGDTATVFVNGAQVATWSDASLQSAGRVNLGTSFDHVRFSNLRVERVPGYAPYYDQLIDDMHMRSWDDGSEILRYSGPWTHDNGQGMFTYMRTISRAAAVGASVSLAFTGTGIDLFGPSDGTARLDVFVDGVQVRSAAPVHATNGSLRCQFRLRDLAYGEHTVVFRTAALGPTGFALDALGLVGAIER